MKPTLLSILGTCIHAEITYNVFSAAMNPTCDPTNLMEPGEVIPDKAPSGTCLSFGKGRSLYNSIEILGCSSTCLCFKQYASSDPDARCDETKALGYNIKESCLNECKADCNGINCGDTATITDSRTRLALFGQGHICANPKADWLYNCPTTGMVKPMTKPPSFIETMRNPATVVIVCLLCASFCFIASLVRWSKHSKELRTRGRNDLLQVTYSRINGCYVYFSCLPLIGILAVRSAFVIELVRSIGQALMLVYYYETIVLITFHHFEEDASKLTAATSALNSKHWAAAPLACCFKPCMKKRKVNAYVLLRNLHWSVRQNMVFCVAISLLTLLIINENRGTINGEEAAILQLLTTLANVAKIVSTMVCIYFIQVFMIAFEPLLHQFKLKKKFAAIQPYFALQGLCVLIIQVSCSQDFSIGPLYDRVSSIAVIANTIDALWALVFSFLAQRAFTVEDFGSLPSLKPAWFAAPRLRHSAFLREPLIPEDFQVPPTADSGHGLNAHGTS